MIFEKSNQVSIKFHIIVIFFKVDYSFMLFVASLINEQVVSYHFYL